jgi:hypothetical protein
MRKRRRSRGRSWTPESGRRGANARWAAHHAAQAGEPVRETRVVEVTVRDSHRPGCTVRLEANETVHGWGRWAVFQAETRIGKRRMGRHAVGDLIAGWMQ